MLKLFKSHLAFVPVLVIVGFMLLLRLDVLLSNYSPNIWEVELAPFSLLLKSLLGEKLLTNNFFNLLVSAFIIFFQAGIILSNFELYKNNDLKSFLPAWIFVLIMHLNPAFLFLSPQLIAFTFVLLAFRKLIIFVENNNNPKAIFDVALYIGIASMFWLPCILFLLFVLYFLIKKTKLNLRVFLSVFFTVLIPFFYVLAYFVLKGQLSSVSDIFTGLKLNQFDINFYSFNKELSGIVLLGITLYSLFFVSSFVSKQLMDIKHFFELINVFIFNTFIVYLFQNDNQVSMIVFLFFPVALFLSILFNRIKRNIVAEFIHLALLLTIIINFMNFT